MTKSLFGGARADFTHTTAGATGYNSGSPGLDIFATDATVRWPIRVPGTMSRLQVKVDANGTGRTYRVRKNGANGNQVVTPTNTTAGTYGDTTNTDHFAAGDTFNVSSTQSGGSASVCYIERILFEADSGHAALYGSLFTAPGTTSTSYFGIAGRGISTTTEANQQNKLRVAGTLKNAAVFVTTSTANTTTVKSRINGADGTISISVTGGTTGAFEDSTHSDSVAAGDLVCFKISGQAATGFAGYAACAIECSETANDISSGRSTSSIAFNASNRYLPIIGSVTDPTTTESNASLQHGFAGTCRNLRIYLSANTFGGTATLATRIAGATGNQSVSIASGATGWFEDTTNSDGFGATDEVNYIFTGGTSGSCTYSFIMMTEVPVRSGAGAASGTGTATGTGASTAAATASAAGTGTVTGVGRSTAASSAAAAGTGTAAGIGVSTAAATGTASGTSTASGIGALTAAASGAAAGVSDPAAVGTGINSAAGSAAGVGAASAVAETTAAAAGEAAGIGTADGAGASSAAADGAASAIGAASAVGASTAASGGSAAGTGIAAAAGASIAAADGAAAGIGTASAVGAATAAAAGSAAGTGAADGSSVDGVAVGAAAGIGTAAAVGTAIAAAAGSASGASTADAVGASTAAGTGVASGTGVAAATGASTAAAAGAAAGTGTATASSTDEIEIEIEAIPEWTLRNSSRRIISLANSRRRVAQLRNGVRRIGTVASS